MNLELHKTVLPERPRNVSPIPGSRIRHWLPAFTTPLWLLFFGCEGNPGAPGAGHLPEDLQPPITNLVLPRAGGTVYDQTPLEAFALDDDSVAQVEFIIDGDFAQPAFSVSTKPWQTIWDCRMLPLGNHLVQARAWDGAGHWGLSSLIVINKAPSDSFPREDTLRMFAPSLDKEVLWMLPDPEFSYGGIGVRMTPDRPCKVTELGFRIYYSSKWQFAGSVIQLQLVKASNGEPDSLIYSKTLRIRPSLDLSDVDEWETARVSYGGASFDGDFFVLVQLPEVPSDTLAVVSSPDAWNTGHSYALRAGNWEQLSSNPSVGYSPLIYALVEY